MIGGIGLMYLLFTINLFFLSWLKAKIKGLDKPMLNWLYGYHMLFAIIYYIYVQSSPSDSVAYYDRSSTLYENWWIIYDHGTPFIDFVAYPFINYLGFTYEMMMVLFAYLGYLGFVFFYVVFHENIKSRLVVMNINLIPFILFLPNMHYWTASLGKGSIIFLGLGLSAYALSQLKSRMISLILGLLIVYHVRPHVFFLLLLGIMVGMLTGKQKIAFVYKLFIVTVAATAVSYLYKDIMDFASLDTEDLFGSFEQLSSHKSVELAKSGSGLDISTYPVLLKLFTFWFRPLFFDAPGPIGIIVSFENLFYIILLFRVLSFRFFRFLFTANALVKINAVILISVSYALCGTLSNLGIIIRQKSMVMYFMIFIILAYMDSRKVKTIRIRPIRFRKKVPFAQMRPAFTNT